MSCLLLILIWTSYPSLGCIQILSPGKKMTRGNRNDPETEFLAVSANTALLQDFGLRHIGLWMLPVNYAPGSYGQGP